MNTSAHGKEPTFGAWITLNSSVLVEQVARLGFGFIVIDGQHGLLSYADMRDSLIAATAGGCSLPIARVSTNDPGEIGRVLDAGAQGVIIPMINSVDDANRAVQAAKYATSGGQRSYSPVRLGTHFSLTPTKTDSKVLVLPMIETHEALQQVEAILDIEGISGVFVGPYDLSLSLGAKKPFAPSHRNELERALTRIREAATERSKIAGIYCGSGEVAIQRAQEGFNLVNTCHDMSALREGMGNQLATVVSARLTVADQLVEEMRDH